MNRVVITKPIIGAYSMQVCAKSECTDEEILSVCNSENPSGTTHDWGTVFRKVDEHHGENCLPVQCKDYSDRTHFIVMC